MFTGIVQAVGRVVEVSPSQLIVLDPEVWHSDPWSLGESISVNGCCLTLVSYTEPGLSFDLSGETWSRTAFKRLKPGDQVNLERAVRAEDRLGGHIVQGHIDSVGRFVSAQPSGDSWIYTFEAQDHRYLIDKGSISIEGVSLTVVNPKDAQFTVWIVPQTHANTSLSSLQPDDPVNIEYDILARYVEKLLSPQ